MPIHTLSRLLNSRRSWIHGTAAALLLGSASELIGQECAPPPEGALRKRPALLAPLGCAPCKKIRREPTREEIEAQVFSEELSVAISAAVAEAVAQQQAQAATATANAGLGTASAPAQFQAPAPTGQIAGASNSVGLRGFEIHFPELRLALPTLQLPSLVKFRREPHMRLDPGEAPMISPASAAPATAPAGYAPQAYAAGPYGYGSPYGYAPATTAPASAPPASAPAAAPATAAPARSAAATVGCRPKTRVRRVGPTKQRFWSDEEEWEVIQEVPAEDCAPDYEAEGAPSSRVPGHAAGRHPAGREYHPVPKAPAADAWGSREEEYVPPELESSHSPHRGPDDLQSARAELAAARRQLAEVTKILAAAGVEVPTASPPSGPADGATSGRTTSPTSSSSRASRSGGTAPRTTALRTAAEQTAPRNRGTQAATVQRLFQELEAVDGQSAPAPDAVAEEGAEEAADVPATTQSRRRPGPLQAAPVQPAGHVTPSPVRKPTAKASQSPVKAPPAASSLRQGKGTVGPGHALGR